MSDGGDVLLPNHSEPAAAGLALPTPRCVPGVAIAAAGAAFGASTAAGAAAAELVAAAAATSAAVFTPPAGLTVYQQQWLQQKQYGSEQQQQHQCLQQQGLPQPRQQGLGPIEGPPLLHSQQPPVQYGLGMPAAAVAGFEAGSPHTRVASSGGCQCTGSCHYYICWAAAACCC